MDIKKSKISGNREWSPSTQKKLASMLGVSAATVLASAALTACDTTSATSGDVVEPTSSEQMTCGMMPCGWEYDESSSSVAESSSSQTRYSSSIDPVGGISSNSEPPRPLSSSYEIDTLDVTSGEVIPPEFLEPESGSNIDTGHLESSSSEAEPSSSSEPEPLPGDPIETIPVEVGPILAGVIEDTPVRMDEPKQ
jgi:hypothetical protein